MTIASHLLPDQSPPEHDPDPVQIPVRHAAPLLDALSSETARAILTTLADEPKPASEVAEAIGTSTQNAMYHINNLQDADLLTVVDTWYSEKGQEMNVYAARYDPFVLTIGATM